MEDQASDTGPYQAFEATELGGWVVVRGEELAIVDPPLVHPTRESALEAAAEHHAGDLADAEVHARFAAEMERLNAADR